MRELLVITTLMGLGYAVQGSLKYVVDESCRAMVEMQYKADWEECRQRLAEIEKPDTKQNSVIVTRLSDDVF